MLKTLVRLLDFMIPWRSSYHTPHLSDSINYLGLPPYSTKVNKVNKCHRKSIWSCILDSENKDYLNLTSLSLLEVSNLKVTMWYWTIYKLALMKKNQSSESFSLLHKEISPAVICDCAGTAYYHFSLQSAQIILDLWLQPWVSIFKNRSLIPEIPDDRASPAPAPVLLLR